MNKNMQIFELFKKYTDKIIEEQSSKMEISKLLELEVAFMNFSIKTYPTNINYVNLILDSCNQILKQKSIANNDSNSMKLLVKLLTIPLDTLSIQVLRMHNFPALMNFMKFSNKRQVALRICKAVIKEGHHLTDLTTVDQLLSFISPLLCDDDQGGKEESYEFEEG
jgi:vacuolar protein sorting-associated protein 35